MMAIRLEQEYESKDGKFMSQELPGKMKVR